MVSHYLLDIDVIIIVVFLLINIVVGFRYRGKKQTFKEYAIGDKQFSSPTLTATIIATWVSGSMLFICLEETYSHGLYFLVAVGVGGSIGLFLTGCVFAARIGKFANNISVPESLGQLYGKTVQVIAGISSVFISIGYIAVQFQAIARVLSILFHYEHTTTVIAAAMIVTFYSLFGGVKAVTFTDVLQFFTFGTIIPVLALAVWNNLQDFGQVSQMLAVNPHFNPREVVKWSPELKGMLSVMSYVMIPILAPELFQRMVMARDAVQAKKSMIYASLIMQGIILCLAWIAILILADRPGLAQDQVVKYMVDTHLHPGLKGLLGVGVIALAMSTADSTINSTAVVIANDIFAPLKGQRAGSLKVAQYATLFLGSFSVVLALLGKSLLGIILLSACFYAPVVTVPMMLAILGFETSRRVVLMSMVSGVIITGGFLVCFKSANSFLPGMLTNLAVMLCAHYLLKEEGGWGRNPISQGIKYLDRRSWLKTLKGVQVPTYLAHILPVKTHFYSFFGFYIFTATYTSFYLLPRAVTLQFPLLYGIMQYSVLLLFTTFLAFPIWPEKLKSDRFMMWIWPLSIFYACFIVGGMLVVLSGFSISHMLIFMLNLVMAVLLLYWPLAVSMAFGGFLFALFTLRPYLDLIDPLDYLNTLQFRIAYSLLLCSSFFLALFKHQQVYRGLEVSNLLLRTTQQETNQALLQALQHREKLAQEMREESTQLFTSIHQMSDQLERETQKLPDEQAIITARETLRAANEKLKAASVYFSQIIYQVKDYMRLKVSEVLIVKLLQQTLQEIKYKQDLQVQGSPVIVQLHTQQARVQCDPEAIQQVLVNGVVYAQQHAEDNQPILLNLSDTTLGYPITSVKDYTKKVRALCIVITTKNTLPTLRDLYMGAVSNIGISLPRSTKMLPLIRNRRIIDEHYGATEFVEDASGITQLYVIPLHLREVRPSTMDSPEMDENVPVASFDSIVSTQEDELLVALSKYPGIDMALISKAMRLIKECHAGVKRKSGEPFYLHPIAVAQILLPYTQDQDTIIASLLHDTVEDTSLSLAQIGSMFNGVVRRIVDGVTHLESNIKTQKRVTLSTYENIQKLLGVDENRVLYVKLADRLHNMRTIEGHSSLEKRRKIAEETLLFFVPIARHLQLHAIEKELQQLASQVMNQPQQ
jgi:Na+/proline symporter/signal transduction histidine kinase